MSESEVTDVQMKSDSVANTEEPKKPKQKKKITIASASSSTNQSDDSAVESIRKFMAEKLGFLNQKSPDFTGKVLEEVTVDAVVKYILSSECDEIVVLAGAGISTSAGIPDFRSPGSGLYNNLGKYNLRNPQAIFEIDFFKENPEPFFDVAKNLFPGGYRPTAAHYFIRLLHEKKLLTRHYTQNIDGLEKVAGVPSEKIVEAHGTFYSSHCLSCKKEYSLDWMKEKIFSVSTPVPKCDDCGGLVKPDIVFFGEAMPERFYQCIQEDFPKAKLLIIMGSSLIVQPFASLVDRVQTHVPRLLINREKVGGPQNRFMSLIGMGLGGSLDLDSEKNVRDVALLGDCDEMVWILVEKLGWKEELQILIRNES